MKSPVFSIMAPLLVLIFLGCLVALTSLIAQQGPGVAQEPRSQFVHVGSEASFSVTAWGDEPLSYRWRKDGLDLEESGRVSGATSAVLTIVDVQRADMGFYSVRLTNDHGELISREAGLSLEPLVGWGRQGTEYGQARVPDGLTDVKAIAAGRSHSLALRFDGTVVGWGRDDGYYGYTSVPPGLSNVVAVAAGNGQSLALRSDGSVVGWGNDSSGQSTPPADLTNAIAIAAGGSFSLALRSDATVIAWGNNFLGQTNVPTDLSNVVAVAAGNGQSLALRSDGTVVAWGAFSVTGIYPAVVPEGLSNVVAIAAGADHALALLADRTVIAWGGGNYYNQTNVPAGLTNVVQIDAGGAYSLALKVDGSLVMWSGREIAFYMEPPTGLNRVVAIAAGDNHALALVDFAYYPLLSIRREAADVTVSWTGGRGPFQLLQRSNFDFHGGWEDIGEPVYSNSVILPIAPGVRFLRVLDLAPRP
jgi:hypothetical protein